MKYRIFACILTAAALTGCFRVEQEEIRLTLPQLKGPECVQHLQQVLGSIQGVTSVDSDLAQNILIVKFESVTVARMNIVYAVANTGFSIEEYPDIPASAEAGKNLPPPCQ